MINASQRFLNQDACSSVATHADTRIDAAQVRIDASLAAGAGPLKILDLLDQDALPAEVAELIAEARNTVSLQVRHALLTGHRRSILLWTMEGSGGHILDDAKHPPTAVLPTAVLLTTVCMHPCMHALVYACNH